MAILRPAESNETTTIQIRVPRIIEDRLKALREAAQAKGLVFPINEIIADQLDKAIREAERELGGNAAAASSDAGPRRRGRPRGPAHATTPAPAPATPQAPAAE